MSERSDDTPERPEAVRDERGSYYYDDATGYEVYKPSDEEEEEASGGDSSECGRT